MAAAPNTLELKFEQLGPMRDALEIIGRIRQIREPITSPDGLRQTIELVLHFAELLGVSGELTDRLGQILANVNVFQIVLGIVRFLLGAAGAETGDGKLRASFADGSTTVIEPQNFLSWLPIVVQIINLIRIIRGGANP
ncbi:MAG: hypothetical protein WD894_16075 [Pirellulales bacterium]